VRIANVAGRCKLLVDGGAVDIEKASSGRFSSHPQEIYDRFSDFRTWGERVTEADEPWDRSQAGPPVPGPRQIFAVALNYVDHANEAGVKAPEAPLIFAKYVSSLVGPVVEVGLPKGSVDWEVELVAVLGATAHEVPVSAAWDCVAGVLVGQDISERELQRSGPVPQFGLAKSFPGFSPTGPCLVTTDELADRDCLTLGCEVNGEEVQKATTQDMIFSVPELVAYLSTVVTLYPGDLIFTGTPPGVGMGRTPPRFLQEGDRLHSWIEGIGEIDQTFVTPPAKAAAQ
jgi:2-keto-4-pentenoate hydratase/2-oxohepta-3-ene-1,7-dioic acid hydratase in catechol pathway